MGLVGATAVVAGTAVGGFAIAPAAVRPEGTSKIMLGYAAGAGAAAILAFVLAFAERGRVHVVAVAVVVILSVGAPLGIFYRQYWVGLRPGECRGVPWSAGT